MGGCATKLRQAFEAEKPEPPVEVEVEVEVEDDKKAADDTEEQFKERVKEIVGEDENENEIAVVDEIQGFKQRPSLSLLFKQEEVMGWSESEKPKNEGKGKQEPISEAQEQEPTRPKEEEQQQDPDPDHDHDDEHELGKITKEEQRDTSEQTKSENVVSSSAS